MRRHTWGNKMEKVRTRLGCSAYHMRHWLRLLRRSRSSSSYPWPISMLHPRGIDRNIYLHCMFYEPFFIQRSIHISHINGSFYSFQLESLFSCDTNPIASLSNNASTVIPSYVSTLSNPIFTITSLSLFSLFRLQPAILSITLLSTVYLLLRLNQGVLSLAPHLNYSVVYFLLP